MCNFLHNLPPISAAVWHAHRMTNFVTIFIWRFFAPVWHSLKHETKKQANALANFTKKDVQPMWLYNENQF